MNERKDGITLFDNRDNRKSDTHPIMKGFVRLNGEEYEVALWPKESAKTGKRFWGGTIKERTEKAPKVEQKPADDPNDKIPF